MAIPRLRDRSLQPRPAFRSIRARTDCRRPARIRRREPQWHCRHRVSRAWAQGARAAGQKENAVRRLRRADRRHVEGVSRCDARLRALPRPQVRSFLAKRLLRNGRNFRKHEEFFGQGRRVPDALHSAVRPRRISHLRELQKVVVGQAAADQRCLRHSHRGAGGRAGRPHGRLHGGRARSLRARQAGRRRGLEAETRRSRTAPLGGLPEGWRRRTAAPRSLGRRGRCRHSRRRRAISSEIPGEIRRVQPAPGRLADQDGGRRRSDEISAG